jgi:hypothetical protein
MERTSSAIGLATAEEAIKKSAAYIMVNVEGELCAIKKGCCAGAGINLA